MWFMQIITYKLQKTKLKIEVLNKIHCYKSLNKAPEMYTKGIENFKKQISA